MCRTRALGRVEHAIGDLEACSAVPPVRTRTSSAPLRNGAYGPIAVSTLWSALSVNFRRVRKWKTLARRVLLSRLPWMEVGDERIELPDGRVIDGFLWVKTREFAIVAAITPDGQVVLERSYKHGPRRVAVALPAGYLEDGESPLETARRELLEETGYQADEWKSLGSFTVDGNYGVSVEHAFLATNARRTRDPGGVGHDDLEEIELFTLPLSEAVALIERGEVAQLSSAAALALAAVAVTTAR